MKGVQIAVDTVKTLPAVALVVDGRLEDLIVDPPYGGAPVPGTIFRAKAARPLKGLGGMFVELPGGASGFLRQAKGVSAGSFLPVQVTSFAEPGKAPPVSARIAVKSRHAIVTPGAPGRNLSRRIRSPEARSRLERLLAEISLPEDFGVVIRSNAEWAAEEDVKADLEEASRDAERAIRNAHGKGVEKAFEGPGCRKVAWRDWPVDAAWDDSPGAFERHGIDESIEELLRPDVDLPNGAGLRIEPTRALVAVDVNTGADASGAACLKANLAAAATLPRELRCRGLGGQIVVDAAPIARSDRGKFESALGKALARDSVETAQLGWTSLGLFELRRHRLRWAWTAQFAQSA